MRDNTESNSRYSVLAVFACVLNFMGGFLLGEFAQNLRGAHRSFGIGVACTLFALAICLIGLALHHDILESNGKGE